MFRGGDNSLFRYLVGWQNGPILQADKMVQYRASLHYRSSVIHASDSPTTVRIYPALIYTAHYSSKEVFVPLVLRKSEYLREYIKSLTFPLNFGENIEAS